MDTVISDERPLPASIAASLQRAFVSSTAGLSGFVGNTETPIHDKLLFSTAVYYRNEWINPFRPLTWKGHFLCLKQPEPGDTNPPWSKHQ